MPQFIEGKVVQQNPLCAGIERLEQLIVRFDLDLDQYAGVLLACAFKCCRDAPGTLNVILLDQYRVEKTSTVILAATAAYSVFLREAQARQRLTRVENACAG